MSQQQLRRRVVRAEPQPVSGSRPGRFVGWLGGFGGVAAAYTVFQSLVGVLPDSLSGDTARYAIAAVSGLGTGVAAWLSAALLRARSRSGTTPGTAPAPPPARPAPGPFPELASAAYDALAAELAVLDDPRRGRLTGWSHALDEPVRPMRPTSVGTAYGLHILLDLGQPFGPLRACDLVETLWRLRLPDGGWAARSQGDVARPEVTALVLGALARAGAAPERLAAEADRCEAGFTSELEPAGLALTHVVTTVLRGLLRAAPASAALPRLREALAAGAITDPLRQNRRCWSSRLSPLQGRPVMPSPAHTAQAVVALDRAARVLPEDAHARAARQDGIRWLLSCPGPAHDRCADLHGSQEMVRRPHADDPSRHEVLSVRHFTAAWVLRALLTPGAREFAMAEGHEEAWRELVSGAASAVWRQQTDGIWIWEGDDLSRPMWMTYQGLSALRAHALCMYQPDA